MFKRKIHVESDGSLKKIATTVINENSISSELRKFSFKRIEFVDYFSFENFNDSKKSKRNDKVSLVSHKKLDKSVFDSVFEYKIDIEGIDYRLFVISPNELFHASYIYEMYRV